MDTRYVINKNISKALINIPINNIKDSLPANISILNIKQFAASLLHNPILPKYVSPTDI